MKEDCNRGRPPCSAFLFDSGKLLPIVLQLALQKWLKKVVLRGIMSLKVG